MKRIFVSILLLLFSVFSYAEVYLKLNIDDCAKCSMILSDLDNYAYSSVIHVVVPKSFETEQLEMKQELGLNSFATFNYVFSDSLYQFLDANGSVQSSEIFIVRDKHICYSAPLEVSYLNEIQVNIRLDTQEEVCWGEKVNKAQRGMLRFKNNVISMDSYKNVSVYNLLTKKHNEIITYEKENLELIYRSLYKSEFDKKFPVIKKIIEEQPRFKPDNYGGYIMLKNDKVLLSYLPWDYSIKGNDSSLHMTSVIMIYDLKKRRFVAGYSKDDSCDFAKAQLYRVVNLKGKLYAHFSLDDKPIFYSIKLDNKRKVFTTASEQAIVPYPNNYFKKVSLEQGNLLNTSRNTILMWGSDAIYSVYHKEFITIPYPNQVTSDISKLRNGLNMYNPTSKLFSILYKLESDNIIYYLTFNDKGERVKFKAIKDIRGGPIEFLNTYELLQYNNSERCFKILKI